MEFICLHGLFFAKIILQRSKSQGKDRFQLKTLSKYIAIWSNYVYMTDRTDTPVCPKMEEEISKRNEYSAKNNNNEVT